MSDAIKNEDGGIACAVTQKGEIINLLCIEDHPRDKKEAEQWASENKEWIQGCLYYIKPEKPHWTETTEPKPDHEFYEYKHGRYIELHKDLIYGVTRIKLLKRKFKSCKTKIIESLTKLLSILGQLFMQLCLMVLVNPFMCIKRVLYYLFTVIPIKNVLKNSTKNLKN